VLPKLSTEQPSVAAPGARAQTQLDSYTASHNLNPRPEASPLNPPRRQNLRPRDRTPQATPAIPCESPPGRRAMPPAPHLLLRRPPRRASSSSTTTTTRRHHCLAAYLPPLAPSPRAALAVVPRARAGVGAASSGGGGRVRARVRVRVRVRVVRS
jgi:hypothetical protein